MRRVVFGQYRLRLLDTLRILHYGGHDPYAHYSSKRHNEVSYSVTKCAEEGSK